MLNDFEKYIISITTDSNYNVAPEFSDAFAAIDIADDLKTPAKVKKTESKQQFEFKKPYDNLTLLPEPNEIYGHEQETNESFFSNLYGFLFEDEKPISVSNAIDSTVATQRPSVAEKTTEIPATTTQRRIESNQIKNNSIPLKLIGILHNTKKENPDKVPIPQRKNNKIHDPTDETFIDLPTASPTDAGFSQTNHSNKVENLTILRDVLLATFNNQPVERNDERLPQSPHFLLPPINTMTAAMVPANAIESKHAYKPNPIRSELDLIVSEFNKNEPNNDANRNNFGTGNYHVLPNDPNHIANTEPYVINPVDLTKLKEHQSMSETKIFTPPAKDATGILKVAGCNIYGRMYRVGRIITELSGPCLECRCTEVGVSCSPLNC